MIHHHDEVNKVQLQTYFITFIIFSNIKGKGDMTIIYNSFAIDISLTIAQTYLEI